MASGYSQFDFANKEIFVKTARRLYGQDVDVDKAYDRFAALSAEHAGNFGAKHCAFFSSPGRIELVGNHTDHQNGKVMCASINLDTLAAATPLEQNKIRIKSGNYPPIEVDLADLELCKGETGTSLALVKGVVKYFVQKGWSVGGFAASMTSNVAKGSGVSSSASFECCIAEILNIFYNDGKIDAVDKAKASQWAESVYFGKPCGLLDQCAIALGGIAYIDFADPVLPKVQKLQFPFDSHIILVNSGGDHSKLTDCYSAIRDEMTAVAHLLGGKVLGDVPYTPDLFAKCKEAGLGGRAVLRALHFYREQERVERALCAIREGNATLFFDTLNASGDSSDRYLQNTYVPGDSAQPIPFAVEFMRSLGAQCCRVHGGGFAGTVLGLFAPKDFAEANRTLVQAYGQENVFCVCIRPDGATYTQLETDL